MGILTGKVSRLRQRRVGLPGHVEKLGIRFAPLCVLMAVDQQVAEAPHRRIGHGLTDPEGMAPVFERDVVANHCACPCEDDAGAKGNVTA